MKIKAILNKFVLVLVFVGSYSLKAQNAFQRTYGNAVGEIPMTLIQTSDNGLAMLGVIDSSNYYPYLVKTDSVGNKQWSKEYKISGFLNPGNPFDANGAIIQTTDKGFLLCGGNVLLKLDKVGSVIWAKEFTVNYTKIIATGGGYILSSANAPAFTKIDTAGNVLWTSERLSSNGIQDIIQSKFDSCYYVLYEDTLIGKLDKQGNGVWIKSIHLCYTCSWFYGGNYAQLGVNPSNGTIGLLVNVNFDNSFQNPFESWISFDNNGNVLNSFTFSTGTYGWEASIYPASWMYSQNGNDMIFTNYMLPETSGNLVEFMSDASGNIKWSEIIGGPKTNYSPCIIPTADKGIATFCTTKNYGANGSVSNYYLLKTDSAGKGICDAINYSFNTSAGVITLMSSAYTFSNFSNPIDSAVNVMAIQTTDTSNNACVCQPPKAGFYTYNQDNFQDSSSYGAQWSWNFGDSTYSSEVDPAHVYADTGFYNVCLTVTNSCGTDSVCHTIHFAYFPAGINSV